MKLVSENNNINKIISITAQNQYNRELIVLAIRCFCSMRYSENSAIIMNLTNNLNKTDEINLCVD